MTLSEQEDQRLWTAVDTAIECLHHLPGSLRRVGDVHYAVHDSYAERAVSLARYLRSAVSAVRDGLNSSGCALLRCAMEHHLLDHLFMRADRYLVQGSISKDAFEQWHQRWQDKAPGTENIADMNRNEGGHARIVFRGPQVADGNGTVDYGLSIYYAYFDEFDPLLGPPQEQRYLMDSWADLEWYEEQARRQQRLYGEAFKWKSICDNLVLNGIYTEQELIRLNVHYRFLSSYVHLTPAADKMVQRQLSYAPAVEAERPHPALELGHLYAAAFAGRELEVFLQMADDRPPVELDGRTDLEVAAAEARTASRHLWFPGDPLHPGDRWRQGSRKAWRREGEPTAEKVGVDEPYYRDPFGRLKELHRGQQMGSDQYVPAFFLPE
jgi:hypothetical protein